MPDINTKKDCTDVTKSFRDLISDKNQHQNDNDEVLGCNTKTSNDDFELFEEFLAEGNQSNIKVHQAGSPDKSSSNNGNLPESLKPTPNSNVVVDGSNHIEASSPSVGVPVQHDAAVLSTSTASNTGVKCRKYWYAVTLVVAVLLRLRRSHHHHLHYLLSVHTGHMSTFRALLTSNQMDQRQKRTATPT